MRFKDICEIWRVKERAAEAAARDAAHADAERAAAERALRDYERRIGEEVLEAQRAGAFAPVALWYPAAEGRRRHLESDLEQTTAVAATARRSLRTTRLEAERLGALRGDLRATRRVDQARRQQKELDELVVHWRRGGGR